MLHHGQDAAQTYAQVTRLVLDEQMVYERVIYAKKFLINVLAIVSEVCFFFRGTYGVTLSFGY